VAVRVQPKLAGAQHEFAGVFHGGAEFARQRPVGALVPDHDAAVDAAARRVARELFQFLRAVEGEHVYANFEGAPDRRDFLDGIPEADRGRLRAHGEAGLDLLVAGGIKTAVEPHQALQHLRCRIGLDGIVDARQRQRILQRAEVGVHAVHVEHQTRRGRLMVSKVTGDLGCHRTWPPL
jgi:hypothetical protein